MGLTWYFGKNNTLVSGSHFHHSDFSDLGWSEAFDEMSVLLERDYAFGEWKGIDWDSLYEEYAGKVADAEKSGDEVAIIRQYGNTLCPCPTGMSVSRETIMGWKKPIPKGVSVLQWCS